MGTFNVEFRIANSAGGADRAFEGAVDTGASFSSLPGSALRALGIKPTDSERFELADGNVIERDISEARIFVNGRNATTIVVFEEDGVEPVLGALALESLRLVVDPLNARLAPVEKLRY